MQIGFKTDKGKKRINNEDALFVMPKEGVFIVADGVGGHNSGELASRTAVSFIAEYIKSNPIKGFEDDEAVKGYFFDCLRNANIKVFNLAKSNEENYGMATTVVMAYVQKTIAYVFNVGDSRAYLIRGKEMTQITEDHTYVNELIKNGTLDLERASEHPQRNMITRALGGERFINPDVYEVKLCKGDMLCLCSDGLYNEVLKDKIAETAYEARTMNSLVNNLVNYANEHGGNDNITVVCIRI